MQSRIALGVGIALVVSIGALGCSGTAPAPTSAPSVAPSDGAAGAGTVVQDAKDAASSAACGANRAQLSQLAAAAQSTAPGAAPDIATLAVQNNVVCPAGGAFSLNATTGKVACSVHGE